MEALTILARCRAIESDKRILQRKIQQRRDAVQYTAPKMDNIGGGHDTSEPDKIGEVIGEISKLEHELQQREQAHSIEMAAACALLDILPESESTVLHEFYVKRNKTPAIARQLSYSEGHVRKVKAAGEKLLCELPEAIVNATLPAWYLTEWPD